jgi:hypothetical protein
MIRIINILGFALFTFPFFVLGFFIVHFVTGFLMGWHYGELGMGKLKDTFK